MKGVFYLLLFLCVSNYVKAQKPSDAVNPNWQNEIPKVIYPDADLVELYEKTWEIAADRVRKGPEGLPATPYLDENCYDDQIWIWDACFMVMFSKYAPNAYPGKQTLENLYYPIHEASTTPLRIHLRDNPPLFAWTEFYNFIFSNDKKHLSYILDEKQYLQRHFDYFNEVPYGEINERVSPNPIFRKVIYDDKNEIRGYSWNGGASGMDNTVRGRDAGGYDKVLWIDAISQQALSALYISRLYKYSNEKGEAEKWEKKYKELKQVINDNYWDENDGFYYDISIDTNEPCRIKTPASFWTLLAEIPNKKQAEQMVQELLESGSLGGKLPWMSLSRYDKDFNASTGDYWRGGIWLPMVYMGTKAIEKYGYYELADELAEKVIRQQLRTYKNYEPHTIWECYSPSKDEPSTEHGRRARPDFCGWSALGPISLFIENIMGFREINAVENLIRWNIKANNGTHGLRNLNFGNTSTDLIYNADKKQIEISSNKPYTLVVNNHKYKIKEGNQVIKFKVL